ncbi:hypothetical protein GCM10009838_26460 [Catenulispora subtropica]|uniref:Uncharacterized protein n=1 Tax=Catenulispora subtropica TaxID=450798 RepID=A0ABN2RCU2_9ACTN
MPPTRYHSAGVRLARSRASREVPAAPAVALAVVAVMARGAPLGRCAVLRRDYFAVAKSLQLVVESAAGRVR